MKNKKYILFIISFLFALLIFTGTSYAGSQEWKSLNYDVKLNKDGSMDVVETWNIRVTDTNTLFKTFKIDKSKYKEITNVNVEQVNGNNQTQKFTKINQPMYHVTKNCYYGLQTKSNEFEIAWGVSVEGSQTNTYKISYKVIDAVKVYNDCSELYWQFLGTDNGISGKNITGTIKLETALDNKENLKAWAHGPLNGEIKIISNDTVTFSLPSIDNKTMLEVRIATLENIFTSSLNTVNSNKLDSIISEETKWADEANNQRIKAKIIVYAINFVIILLGIWFITRIIKYNKIRKEIKKLEPTMKVDYFRDIPDENATPAEVAFLYYFKSGGVKPNISKIFSATLLDLCLKKILTFEMTDESKISNVKIILTRNNDAILTDSEKIIYNQLEKMATKYGDSFTIKQLQSYIKSNSERFVKDLEKIDDLVKKEQQEKQNYDKNIAKKAANYQSLCVVYIVFAVMCGFCVLMYIFFSIILSAILIVNAILCGNIASRYNGLTQKGVDEKELWRGLKKYIEEFSMIDEKEVPELVLWEKYLVFATVFGIADKVIKQLKVVYPQLSEEDVLVGNYTYMHIMCHSNFNVNFVTSLNRTISSAYSSAYSSTYSSGSGSGGGFSVGGGGRRRRWPVAEEDKKEFIDWKINIITLKN